MELNKYQETAMSTLVSSAANEPYMLYGLVGEVGELFSNYAKDIRDNSEGFYDRFEKELGDVLWFVAGLAHINGYTLEEIAEKNISKLKSRQERGTIHGNGDTR